MGRHELGQRNNNEQHSARRTALSSVVLYSHTRPVIKLYGYHQIHVLKPRLTTLPIPQYGEDVNVNEQNKRSADV